MKFFQIYTLAVLNSQVQISYNISPFKRFLKKDGSPESNFIFVPTESSDLADLAPPTSSPASSTSHRSEKLGFADENSAEDMKFAKVRHQLVREFLAETLGTFMLVLFGNGAIAQFKGMGAPNPFMHVAFGYGLGLTLGILVSGGVSGGHLNPAVTLAMAVLKKCKWIQLPVYWAAQYLGAFLASAILFGTYADFINVGGKPGNAGIFASYPGDFGPSTITLILDQFLGTALLLIIILSVTDGLNMKVTSGLVPLYIGLGLTAIHLSFALNAGCAINPARDFAPRLFTLIAGFGKDTFTAYDSFFWIPWVVPHFGAIFGAGLYYIMIEHHHKDEQP